MKEAGIFLLLMSLLFTSQSGYAERYQNHSNVNAVKSITNGAIETSLTASPIEVYAVLSYADRNQQTQRGRNYLCRVYDYDVYSIDDIVWEGETGSDGVIISGPIPNYDEDSDDGNPRLDIYIGCFTYNSNLDQYVYSTGWNVYGWVSSVSFNELGGSPTNKSIHVSYSDENVPAMWIFEDILRTNEYWNSYTGSTPPTIRVVWQNDTNSYGACIDVSCYIPGSTPEVFIKNESRISQDTVVHELAHAYMDHIRNLSVSCPSPHYITGVSNLGCAWSEGWAEFLPLLINGDGCYDWDLGPCSGSYINIEDHNLFDLPVQFSFGDAVEGRVAGALFDLVDGTNELFDLTSVQLGYIVDVLNSPLPLGNFRDFWDNWLTLGNGNEGELMSTFYLNTVGKKLYIPMMFSGE